VRSIRWPIAVLITVAVAIGYLDRQTLALTTKAIQKDIPLSDSDFGNLQSLFYFAYALMYVGGGRLMDLLRSRRGFLLIMV
jgi:ACS family hexuronate transporter-like MFS transporter